MTIAYIDVGYDEENDQAHAACVVFENWTDRKASEERLLTIDKVQPYVPGQFYRRELPCVLAVLHELASTPSLVVVDGYVWLDADNKPGLGGHLYHALHEKVPVVGIAKTHFATATPTEVLRGTSKRPLYVTATGIEVSVVAENVRKMHGKHRLPTLLQRCDRLSKQNL